MQQPRDLEGPDFVDRAAGKAGAVSGRTICSLDLLLIEIEAERQHHWAEPYRGALARQIRLLLVPL
jgi:hypothetical protein